MGGCHGRWLEVRGETTWEWLEVTWRDDFGVAGVEWKDDTGVTWEGVVAVRYGHSGSGWERV